MTLPILREFRDGAYCRVLGPVVAEGIYAYQCEPCAGRRYTVEKDRPGIHLTPCSFCEPVAIEERIAA